MKNRNDLIEDAIKFIDEKGGTYAPELIADFVRENVFTWNVELLLEAVGMHCQSCPVEVQEALHKIPEIEKVHFSHPFEEPETRMARLARRS